MEEAAKQKKFYAVFFSLFIIIGLGMAIFGFVRLGQYNSAEDGWLLIRPNKPKRWIIDVS